MKTAIILISLLLSSCASTSVCPPLTFYSDEENRQIIKAIEELPEDSILIDVTSDYWVLRNQVRACQ